MEKTGFFPFQQYKQPSVSAYEIKKLNESIDKLNELMKSLVLTSQTSNSLKKVVSPKRSSTGTTGRSDKIKEYIELFDKQEIISKRESSGSISDKIKELIELYDKKDIIPKRERSSSDKIKEVIQQLDKKAVIPKRERSSFDKIRGDSEDSLNDLVGLLQKVKMPKKKKQRAKEVEVLKDNFDVMQLEGKRKGKRVNKYSDSKEQKRHEKMKEENKRSRK